MENDNKLVKESKGAMAQIFAKKKRTLASKHVSAPASKGKSERHQAKRDQDGHDYDNTN